MKTVVSIVSAAVVATLFGLLAGCSQSEQQGVHEQVQGIRQEASKAADEASHAARNLGLEGTVKAALAAHKDLDSSKIHVEARDGQVTLSGDVPSKKQAGVATQVASETKGVDHVKSELTVPVPAKDMH